MPTRRHSWTHAALALPLAIALGACASAEKTYASSPPNSVEAILGPVDLDDEMAPVLADEPETPEAIATITPEPTPTATTAATQTISFDGPDADPGLSDEVSAPPKRPTLPALKLFGSGGRSGPGG
jgi:hypothetical protein